MTIILNEHEWAKNMITAHSLGKRPAETLGHVARYYIDEHQGDKPLSKKELKKKLESFLLQCDSSISVPKWDGTLTRVVNRACKRSTIYIEYIPVTESELSKIGTLKSKQVRRLAFTLLCLSKYWDIINSTKTHWVNSQDSDIMKMANLRPNLKERCGMFHDLERLGFIKFSKRVDNTNVQVCFVEEGDIVLKVTDFRNLGYQYERYCGEPCRTCQHCGIVFKLRKGGRGNYPKYCNECSRSIYLQQSIASVMRNRNKNIHTICT